MNAEILHDALNLLPGDLITAVDALRSQPRKEKSHWLRHAAMAACFALLLCGGLLIAPFFFGMGGSTAPMDAELMQEAADYAMNDSVAEAPMEQKPAAEEPAETKAPVPTGACTSEETGGGDPWINARTQYIQTPFLNGMLYGPLYPRTSVIRSVAELEAYCEDRKINFDMESFRESCRVYDDAFFAEHDLLLTEVLESYDAIHHEVLGLTKLEDGSWELTIRRYDGNMAASETCIPMCILMDVRKDAIQAEDTVSVILETEGEA